MKTRIDWYVLFLWMSTAALAGTFLWGCFRTLSGPRAPWLESNLVAFCATFTLCCGATSPRDIIVARIFIRNARKKIAAISSYIRLSIPRAKARIRNLAGPLYHNGNLQTEP